MTSPRRFEQDLPALLADLYLAGTPDYRDDLVQQVARVRQRPAWTFPERWLPMDLVDQGECLAHRASHGGIVGVLALLAILLVGDARRVYRLAASRLPAPFGLAGNGSIAFSTDGDIYTADPVTGEVRRDRHRSRDGRRVPSSPATARMLVFHGMVGTGSAPSSSCRR